MEGIFPPLLLSYFVFLIENFNFLERNKVLKETLQRKKIINLFGT
jgi:hypothetical protein